MSRQSILSYVKVSQISMSEFEGLTNKELRKMCVEHQLPNIPVTDTTRGIVIRRLEAAISGKAHSTDKKVNPRIKHVSTAAVSEDSSASSVKTGNNRPTRQTGAVSKRRVSTTKQVHVKMQTPVKENLHAKLPSKEPLPKQVMISKTNVVTTSFIQEAKEDANKIYADAGERGQTTTSQIQPKAVLIHQKEPTTYNSASGAQQDYNYNKSGPQYTAEYDDYDDDDVDRPDGYDDDDVKTRFLSKFARNLENLKAAPLADKYSPLSGAAVNLRQRESLGRRRIRTSSGKVTSRRSSQATLPKPDAVNDAFWQLIEALQEKYQLKWPLLVAVLMGITCS
ncbi:hypothetical protein GQX74_002849 [Glossina fuscipes]|nr:hypothetical protein GQX74_002849 [Glossina fuscipes]